MSEDLHKRVKILLGTDTPSPGAPAQPVRKISVDQWKNVSGLTRHRSLGEESAAQVCTIIFPQSAYQTVVDHLSMDTTREHGGFLLGYELHSSEAAEPAVVVECAVPASHTQGTPVRLTFTEETWRKLDEVTDKYSELGRPLQRVGWYHSHPNISIFLSHYDLDVCTIFDRRRYPIALVVDPVKKRGGFFVRGRTGYTPDCVQGFYELHDNQPESVVQWSNMTRSASSLPNRPKPTESQPIQPDRGAPVSPIKITNTKTKKKSIGVSVLRILTTFLFCAMLAALLLLIYQERQMAQTLSETKEKLARVSSEAENLRIKLKNQQIPSRPADNANPPPKPTPTPKNHTVVNPPALSDQDITYKIDPGQTNLGQGQSQTFGVKGVNVRNWTIQPTNLGKIDKNGKYTAPQKISSPQTVTIIATLGSHRDITATVNLVPPPKANDGPGNQAGEARGSASGKGATGESGNQPTPTPAAQATPTPQNPANSAQQDSYKKFGDNNSSPAHPTTPAEPVKQTDKPHSATGGAPPTTTGTDPTKAQGTAGGTEQKNQAEFGPSPTPNPTPPKF